MVEPQEQTVIAEIRKGQTDAYRYLVERYHRGLIQHLYNLTRDEQAAEDLAQEAFITAYNKLAQYNPNFAFSTWLYKIADNLTWRYLDKAKLTRPLDDEDNLLQDNGPTPSEQAEASFTKAAISRAIRKLPTTYQQVIILYYWDNVSYEDIALIMDRPIGTVRTWLYRAKEQLRKELYGQV